MSTVSREMIRDLDTDPVDQLYCGNCGMDYSDMSVAGLREIVEERGCPACRQYLESLISEAGS